MSAPVPPRPTSPWARRQSPGLANAHRQSPGLANARRQSPGLANVRRQSPGLANARRQSPGLASCQPRTWLGGPLYRSLACLALLLTVLVAPAWAEPFAPVGVWRVGHGDGTFLQIQVYPDGRAASDWQNQRGTWSWDGDRLVLQWTDGWADLIYRLPSGAFEKVAYGPGADRHGKPSNRTPAEHLRAQPDPGGKATPGQE